MSFTALSFLIIGWFIVGVGTCAIFYQWAKQQIMNTSPTYMRGVLLIISGAFLVCVATGLRYENFFLTGMTLHIGLPLILTGLSLGFYQGLRMYFSGDNLEKRGIHWRRSVRCYCIGAIGAAYFLTGPIMAWIVY